MTFTSVLVTPLKFTIWTSRETHLNPIYIFKQFYINKSTKSIKYINDIDILVDNRFIVLDNLIRSVFFSDKIY